MKRIYLIAGLALLWACNDSSDHTSTTQGDTADHGAAHTNTPAASPMDTAGMAGQSMMSLMQKNMDQMKAMSSTGNPDNDFAAMMKTHHMGAVEMSQLELAKGTNAEMKAMAQKMLDEQQKEIAELNTFLSGHSAHGGGDAFHKKMMSQMGSMKMEMDHSGSMDRQFAQMMIPHHQGAIDMAKTYLASGGTR